jgi:hypothetical protein
MTARDVLIRCSSPFWRELRLNTHIECPKMVTRGRIWSCLHPEGPVGLGAGSQNQDAILASQLSLTREEPSFH